MSINWSQIASLAEVGGNIALTFLGAAGIVPANAAGIAQAVEASVTPLLDAIHGKAPVATDIQAGYGAIVGSMNALKLQVGLDPALLAKAEEYAAAALAGLTGYSAAGAGYDPSLFQVAAPLAPATEPAP